MLPAGDSALRARLLASLGLELFFDPDRPRRLALGDNAGHGPPGSGIPPRSSICFPPAPSPSPPRTPSTSDPRHRRADRHRRSSCSDPVYVKDLGGPVPGSLSTDPTSRRWIGALGEFPGGWRRRFAGPVVRSTAGLSQVGPAHPRPARSSKPRTLPSTTDSTSSAATVSPTPRRLLQAHRYLDRLERGRLTEVESDVGGLMDKMGGRYLPSTKDLSRGDVLRARPARARHQDVVRLDGRDGFDLPLDSVWLLGITVYANVTVPLGVTDWAEQFSSCWRPTLTVGDDGWASHGARRPPLGALATLLGRFDEAEAQFAAATDLHGRIGAPCWLARTRLEWSRMLLRRGGPATPAGPGSPGPGAGHGRGPPAGQRGAPGPGPARRGAVTQPGTRRTKKATRTRRRSRPGERPTADSGQNNDGGDGGGHGQESPSHSLPARGHTVVTNEAERDDTRVDSPDELISVCPAQRH